MIDTRSTPWLAIVIVLVLLPVLYVLSCGPVASLVFSRRMSADTYETIYWPIGLVIGRSPLAKHFFGQYINCFNFSEHQLEAPDTVP